MTLIAYAALVLQTALALLTSANTSTATDLQRQQAIAAATQAIQLATPLLQQNGGAEGGAGGSTPPSPSIYLSVSPKTVNSGSVAVFSWNVPAKETSEVPTPSNSFTISCVSGVTLTDTATNQDFQCGDV